MATIATSTNTQQFVIANGRQPATVVFPGAKTPELDRLRSAWANLMDTGRHLEADQVKAEFAAADDAETAIEAALAEIAAIERHGRKIVDPATQEKFEAHVNTCARNLFPRGGRAGQIFVETALAIGWGGDDPIGRARAAAHAFLHPAPLAGLGNRTSNSQREQPARRHRQLARIEEDRKLIRRTGTGSNGS